MAQMVQAQWKDSEEEKERQLVIRSHWMVKEENTKSRVLGMVKFDLNE
jgi:hypothetical protein